jgi:hypothetical protein
VLVVDLSHAPFVLHTWSGHGTDDDFVILRQYLDWEVARSEPVYIFLDLRRVHLPSSLMRRTIAALFREYEPRRKNAVLVVIFDSWVIVSMMNALRWFIEPKTPEVFVPNMMSAIEAMERAGAPPLPPALRAKLLDDGEALSA